MPFQGVGVRRDSHPFQFSGAHAGGCFILLTLFVVRGIYGPFGAEYHT